MTRSSSSIDFLEIPLPPKILYKVQKFKLVFLYPPLRSVPLLYLFLYLQLPFMNYPL